MICRVATHDKTPDLTDDRALAFRAWMKSQPGFLSAYHVNDPRTGKTLSISFWDTEDHLLAMRDRVPPDGPAGLKPTSVEIFHAVEQF